jgi:hypothetical protein
MRQGFVAWRRSWRPARGPDAVGRLVEQAPDSITRRNASLLIGDQLLGDRGRGGRALGHVGKRAGSEVSGTLDGAIGDHLGG